VEATRPVLLLLLLLLVPQAPTRLW
jgi:hypothetical protein